MGTAYGKNCIIVIITYEGYMDAVKSTNLYKLRQLFVLVRTINMITYNNNNNKSK